MSAAGGRGPAGAAPRTLYIDSIGGMAGDMLLAALLDAGAPEQALLEVPERLGLVGVELRLQRVERHAIGALQVAVEAGPDAAASHGANHDHVHWRSIRERVGSAELDAGVAAGALDVLGRLAEVEARIHGIPTDEVHFHEIGAVDTLVDVVGTVALIEQLGVSRIVCSPMPLGHGTVRAAHGVLPLPAPATVALLLGAPVYGIELQAETVTPTGAALVTTLADAWGRLPAMTCERVGYGAGSADFPARANLVRVLVGTEAGGAGVPTGEVVLLQTNLDDLSPELIPDAAEQCFAAGALDVWSAPVTMKKGRPGVVFSALARPEQKAAVAAAMLTHTSALGVRTAAWQRYELDRELRTVTIDGHAVRVKLGRLLGEVVNVAPEHDDCAAVARIQGVPVKSIWVAALAAARELA